MDDLLGSMHVEQVWGADSKVKILRSLAQPGFPQRDATQLAAETGLSLAGVRNTLRELTATGIIQPFARGRITFFAFNADHSMARSILDAFRVETSAQGIEHLGPTFWNHLVRVVDKITERDGVLFVLLHGSITQPPVYPNADVDLLVGMDPTEIAPEHYSRRQRRMVSDTRTDKTDLEAMTESVMGHPVHIITTNAAEFEDKARTNDPFAANVLARNVILYMDANYDFPWTTPTPGAPAPRKSWGGSWRNWGNSKSRGGW